MDHFTPISALIGGVLIGTATSLLLLCSGRIAGVSGMLGGLVAPSSDGRSWRGLFLAGLVLGAGAVRLAGQAPMPAPAAPLETLAVAGFAVGLGTRIGNGCTSGHGVCGIARLSPRSLAATVTFLTSGMITVFIVRHVLGGWR